MDPAILPQLLTAVLLLATPIVLRRGMPSTEPLSRTLRSLLKSLRFQRPRHKDRSLAMRGARPWWE